MEHKDLLSLFPKMASDDLEQRDAMSNERDDAALDPEAAAVRENQDEPSDAEEFNGPLMNEPKLHLEERNRRIEERFHQLLEEGRSAILDETPSGRLVLHVF